MEFCDYTKSNLHMKNSHTMKKFKLSCHIKYASDMSYSCKQILIRNKNYKDLRVSKKNRKFINRKFVPIDSWLIKYYTKILFISILFLFLLF